MKSVFFLVGPFVFSERNGHFEGFESDFVSKQKAKNLFHFFRGCSALPVVFLPPKFGETRPFLAREIMSSTPEMATTKRKLSFFDPQWPDFCGG